LKAQDIDLLDFCLNCLMGNREYPSHSFIAL